MNLRRRAVLFAVVISALLFHFVPIDVADYRIDAALQNVMHVIGFAVVAFVMTGSCERRNRRPSHYVAGAALAVGIALLAEALQAATQRNPSLEDLVLDGFGITGGVFARLALDAQSAVRIVYLAIAAMPLAAGLGPPATLLAGWWSLQNRTPVVLGFENRFDRALVEGVASELRFIPAPEKWQRGGGHVAYIQPMGATNYPGVSFFALPSDWSGYKTVSFLAASAGVARATLVIRVHDAEHNQSYEDRFNASYELTGVPQRIRVPVAEVQDGGSRLLDITRISELILFTTGPERAAFYVDDLRLE